MLLHEHWLQLKNPLLFASDSFTILKLLLLTTSQSVHITSYYNRSNIVTHTQLNAIQIHNARLQLMGAVRRSAGDVGFAHAYAVATHVYLLLSRCDLNFNKKTYSR